MAECGVIGAERENDRQISWAGYPLILSSCGAGTHRPMRTEDQVLLRVGRWQDALEL
jgi:hypothetical protein